MKNLFTLIKRYNYDRGKENKCDSEEYNYSYIDLDSKFQSSLAYDYKLGKCNSLTKVKCLQVQYFSNIEFDFYSKAIRDKYNNNTFQINLVAEKLVVISDF